MLDSTVGGLLPVALGAALAKIDGAALAKTDGGALAKTDGSALVLGSLLDDGSALGATVVVGLLVEVGDKLPP